MNANPLAAIERRRVAVVAMIALAISIAVPVATAAPASAATYGEIAAQYTRDNLVGKPYKLGSTTASQFDCSGGARLAWNHAVPGLYPSTTSSSTMYNEVGTKISVGRNTTLSNSSLLPGDLLFWSTTGNTADIYHVAMYLGNGQILQTAKDKNSWLGGINDNKSLRMAYAVRPKAGSSSTTTPPPSDPSPTYKQITDNGTNNWWGSTHWNRLSQAIGQPQDGNNFGRSPAFKSHGTYSARAKAFQNYLNANDGNKTNNIGADGYWGPVTTEKLRAVIDHKCGQSTKLLSDTTMDGKRSGGTTYSFGTTEARALAKCLNVNKF